jgi:methionyl-tRNA formyltransferase
MLEDAFGDVEVVAWDHGQGDKPRISARRRDWIFSFKSDIILSRDVLSVVVEGALNFHPAPPEYRGIGGYYYAIANGDASFGATCHLMDEHIDHGPIVEVRRYAIDASDNVESLLRRSAHACLHLLGGVITLISVGAPLHASSDERWSPTLYTRARLDELLREGADAGGEPLAEATAP